MNIVGVASLTRPGGERGESGTMHSVDRKCLPDCQTIHHEIARKTVLIICAGRSAEEGTGKNNNWVGAVEDAKLLTVDAICVWFARVDSLD